MSTATQSTAIQTTTDQTTTVPAGAARRRRMIAVAAVVAASIVLGACNSAPSATGAGTADAPAGSAATTSADRSDRVGPAERTPSRFGRTERIDAGVVSLRSTTDEHGNEVLVPQLRSADDHGPATGDRQALLHRQGEEATTDDTGSWSSMYEFVEFVIQANDSYWVQVFEENGLPEPMVSYVIPEPGVTYETACGPTDDNSMFYCPTDDQIAFSQSIATRLWDGTYVGPDGQVALGQVGDFATALLVSHEVAHSIQSELGYGSNNVEVPMLEQHADCWAGVFTAYADSAGMLDANDLNEGVVGAFLVGDSQFDSPDHHGTSEDRIIAFATGYNGGSPDACDGYLPA